MVSHEQIRQFMLGMLDEESAEEVARYLEAHPSRIAEAEALESDAFLLRMRGAVGEIPAIPERDISTASFITDGNTKVSEFSEPENPIHPIERRMSLIPNLHPELAALEQYEFIKEIGSGGMSVVYLAENLHMGRRKEALKILNQGLLRLPIARERFEQEIAVASQLEHPNIVVAYSALRLKSLSVFAMQYVQGQDLHELVKEKGPLRIATACGVIRQVAAGLQYAHEMKTIHRDIKPANLMLTKSGSKDIVKILDFGLAKAQMEMEKPGGLTSTSAGMGTAQYMAPEQVISAAKVDIRADIYSLGCTLYFLLAGRAPFHGSDFEVYRAHQSEEPKPLNLIRSDVPIELVAVLAKMLAKDPNKRFAKPGEIIEALAPFMHLKGAAAVEKSVSGRQPDSDPPRTLPESTPVAAAVVPEVLAKTQFETRPEVRMAKPREANQGSGKPPKKWMAIGLGGLFAFFVLFAIYSGILKVKTPNGTLVFQQLPEDADVLVDGERVFVIWDNAREKATITIPAGTHQVEVQKNGIKVEGTSVTVSSGERTQLVVRAEPIPPPDPTPPVAKNERTTIETNENHGTNQNIVANDASRRTPTPPPEQPVRQPTPSSPSTFTNSLGMKMVYISPPGEFWMGSSTSEVGRESDEYQHKVRLTEGYYLAAHEVTRGQFAEFVASGYTKNQEWNSPGFEQSDDHPVVNVSYEDAVAFAEWLSKRESRSYSLPSEAEWEFACRGVRGGSSSDSTPYWFGKDASQLKNYANVSGTDGKDRFLYTAPVGSFPPNPFGIFDMHGNVWEWCSDWYDSKDYENSPVENPQGPTSGSLRVDRGGSWNSTPEFSRSAGRDWNFPSSRGLILGFRLRSSVK